MAEIDETSYESTAVVICGAGPTGATLSALLGRMNVPNIVLEKEHDITTDPRGIALDEDGIRILQNIGCYDRVFTRIGCPHDIQFLSLGEHERDLSKRPLVVFDSTICGGTTGHVPMIFHKQPEMERAMRDIISQRACCDLRTGATLTSVQETDRKVDVAYVDARGAEKRVRARFLIGADGKTGYVRKQYLEPRGILLEPCPGTDYDETWVALNWQMHLPTPETHPEFPLWSLGYSPQQVYDLFFPESFRFLCVPSRPAVCGRFGLYKDMLWRFEFVVHPHEDPDQMASDEETRKIIDPFLIHPGSRYGLATPVRYPADCIITLRSRPFRFQARSCNKWALGRTILIGDAAHVFPPYAGQGIASGMRDALGLAWRLALLYRNDELDHDRFLRGWYTERKQQLNRSLASTVHNGVLLTEPNPWKIIARDWLLWAVQLVPSWRRKIQLGSQANGCTRYEYSDGLPFISELRGGLDFPQVYAWDFGTRKVSFTDDLIFSSSKIGLFQILVLVDHTEQIPKAIESIKGSSELTLGMVLESEATIIVSDMNVEDIGVWSRGTTTVARLASADEFAADPVLCAGRLKPKNYNPFKMQEELGMKSAYVLLRSDRFLYAACRNRMEFTRALENLRSWSFDKQLSSKL